MEAQALQHSNEKERGPPVLAQQWGVSQPRGRTNETRKSKSKSKSKTKDNNRQ